MPVVLVTGSAKRLGRAIAQKLAAQGWSVAVHYRHSQQQAEQLCEDLKTQGAQAQIFCADLTKEGACHTLVQQVVQQMGTIDAIVNNASLFDHDEAMSFTEATLNQHMQIHLVAPVLLAQALFQHRSTLDLDVDAPKAVVVNLLDQKLWNLNPDHFSYTLSKSALHTATQMLGMSLATHLRVVGIAPGLTLPSQHMQETDFNRLHQLSPLGRSSTPEDIAKTVAFVLDNQAITGTTLLVDGGQHLMPQARDFSFINTKTS